MYITERINLNNEIEFREIQQFLQKFDVKYTGADETVAVRQEGKIVATGSVEGYVLKYFFCEDAHRGSGLMLLIYNELLTYLMLKGITHHFVYTKPSNRTLFQSMGLREIIATDKVLLLEGGMRNFNNWTDSVRKFLNSNARSRSAVVANLNPMTNGHFFLINEAKKTCDELVIFVVQEDRSTFPFKDRIAIAKNACSSIEGVKVIPGGPYIISESTFPTYFLKKVDDATDIYTELDVKIFVKIAKCLGINKRIAGTEPYDELTLKYNEKMREILPKEGIEFIEISRKDFEGKPISASFVRTLIRDGKSVENYVPPATLDFLKSEQGKLIERKIKGGI